MNARYNTMTAKAIEHERARSFMKAADCWGLMTAKRKQAGG
jgi:hypothetical protein